MTEDERRDAKDRLLMAQIDKIAFDTDLARRQERWDIRKFIVTTALTALVAFAAAVGAGVGVGNLIWAHHEPPPPIIIQVPK